MTTDDILKLVNLTQSEINLLSDKNGLYRNSTTNSLEYNGSGLNSTPEAMDIISLSSTDVTSSINQSTPSILQWDVENYKDSGFTHDNTTNNTRIQVDENGTYKIQGNIRISSNEQRAQFVLKILIDGVVQSQSYGSSYIRNSGNSSDFWTCVVNVAPLKLTAGQYIEIQAQIESQVTTSITGVFVGTGSSFSVVNLQGVKGEKGDTGTGSNVIVQKDDVTVGTLTDTLNFEGNITSNDEGGGKTTITVGSGQVWYKQKSTNTSGGTVNAAFGSPVECVPFTGVLEINVVESGDYVIYGAITTRANLNSDSGAIELAYGVDTGTGAVVGPQPYRENMNAKKNRRNGIQGTWGDVSLNSGDVVHLFLSTLGDNTTWDSGEIFIQTWK